MKQILLIIILLSAILLNGQSYDFHYSTDKSYQEFEGGKTIYSEWNSNTGLSTFNEDIKITSYSNVYDVQQDYIGISHSGYLALLSYSENKATVVDAFLLTTKSGEGSAITFHQTEVEMKQYIVVQYKNAYLDGLPEGDGSYLNYQIWMNIETGATQIKIGECLVTPAAETAFDNLVFGYFETDASFQAVYETMFVTGDFVSPVVDRIETFAPISTFPANNSVIEFTEMSSGIETISLSTETLQSLLTVPSTELNIYDIKGSYLGNNLQLLLSSGLGYGQYLIRHKNKVYKAIF